eukprot:scaffold19740_cov100-Isochrysis_galbana.AAC.2
MGMGGACGIDGSILAENGRRVLIVGRAARWTLEIDRAFDRGNRRLHNFDRENGRRVYCGKSGTLDSGNRPRI